MTSPAVFSDQFGRQAAFGPSRSRPNFVKQIGLGARQASASSNAGFSAALLCRRLAQSRWWRVASDFFETRPGCHPSRSDLSWDRSCIQHLEAQIRGHINNGRRSNPVRRGLSICRISQYLLCEHAPQSKGYPSIRRSASSWGPLYFVLTYVFARPYLNEASAGVTELLQLWVLLACAKRPSPFCGVQVPEPACGA
jgi:hypothetical protein